MTFIIIYIPGASQKAKQNKLLEKVGKNLEVTGVGLVFIAGDYPRSSD